MEKKNYVSPSVELLQVEMTNILQTVSPATPTTPGNPAPRPRTGTGTF